MDSQVSMFSCFDYAEQDVKTTVKRKTAKILPPIPSAKSTNYVNNAKVGGHTAAHAITDQDELEAMADWLYRNADRKYFLGFVLNVNLGLRANELLELKKSDVFYPDGKVRYSADLDDLSDEIRIDQSKTHSRRSIFLNAVCVAALEWYYPAYSRSYSKDSETDYLFPSREGGHISVDCFRKVLKKAANACGLTQNIGTHSMRKSFASLMVSSRDEDNDRYTRNIGTVQFMLGHKDVMTTLAYIGELDKEYKRNYHKNAVNIASSVIGKVDGVFS